MSATLPLFDLAVQVPLCLAQRYQVDFTLLASCSGDVLQAIAEAVVEFPILDDVYRFMLSAVNVVGRMVDLIMC